MENIAKAIISVMKEVKGMEKNSVVGVGTKAAYNGTKDQDVKEVFNDALSNHGLCMMPIDIQEETQIDRWEEETNYGKKQKQSVFTKVKTKYLLLHNSGESIEIAGYGHGVDSQDKGAGKATTYAMKNALLYTFMTPVGKIDDSDLTHSQDIEVPKANNDDLPWLNEKDDVYPKIKGRVKNGTPISEVRKHYKISKKTEELLKA